MTGDVIAAISTPPGKGGVAIIRVSGKGAIEIANEVFSPRSGKAISSYPERMQIYGYIIDKEDKLDDGMLTYFPSPRSYTGEDTVEISCHGGIVVTREILKLLFTKGARPAEPGEFTRRAFINGKISLTEAEAVGSLLEASSREQLLLNAEDSRQRLKSKIEEIRSRLTDILSSTYARIDYPDEELGDFTDDECLDNLYTAREQIKALISSYKVGRAINEGIKTLIVGKPNVGKSTLYNILLGEDAAIVTDIAGTTRDLLECTVNLGAVKLSLTDTAGIRSTDGIDLVEKIGIEKTKAKILATDLCLVLFDTSRPLDSEDEELISMLWGAPCVKIAILTKSDLDKNVLTEDNLPNELFSTVVRVCCTEPEEAKQRLRCATERLFFDEKISIKTNPIVSTARQAASLDCALGFIESAINSYKSHLTCDLASSDVELSLRAIAELDGRAVAESVTNDIFAKFCVGK
jgi:tRNA modification GTPase